MSNEDADRPSEPMPGPLRLACFIVGLGIALALAQLVGVAVQLVR